MQFPLTVPFCVGFIMWGRVGEPMQIKKSMGVTLKSEA